MGSSRTRTRTLEAALAIAALAFPIAPASASDFGVGVLLLGEDRTLLLPVKMGSLVVEPEIYFNNAKQDQATTTTPPGTSTTSDGKSRGYGVGTGVYARFNLAESLEAYAGGRVGVTRSKQDQTTGATTFTSTFETWFIAPTLGLQYFLMKRFSLSLDIGLAYEDQEQTFRQTVPATQVEQVFNSKGWDTRTRVILRGYF